MAENTRPRVEMVLVTPEKAQEWLTRNTHNRNLRQRTVGAYASDMRAGKWVLNGETIKFSIDGRLDDGQHRLAAVVESETAQWLTVVWDVPAGAQETTDTGVPRKFADVLTLRGETNASALAATIRLVASWERYGVGRVNTGRVPITNSQLLDTLEKYPWIREGMPLAGRVGHSIKIPTSIAGFAWWLFVQIDPEDTEAFFERLVSGENLSKGNPILTLRNALVNIASVRGEADKRYRLAIVIKAWNAYRAGDDLFLLKFRSGGANPEAFPEPH